MEPVRRAVLNQPDTDSDPETDSEDYEPEMEKHYGIMEKTIKLRRWLS